MGLYFYLFGDLRIIHDERVLPPLPYRVQNLLAFLLLRPRVSQRELIVDALYPASSPAQGRRNLSDVLYRLRQALPAAIISSDRSCIRLDATVCWLDVRDFRQAVLSQSPDQWERGLELYRGDLLPGNYEDWLLEEREVLHLDFVAMAHRFCETMAKQHAYDRALSVAERLLQEEPYDEKALQHLMQIYQALGRRGYALQVYEQFAERMASELGLKPHPGTQILAENIRDACPVFFSPDVPHIVAHDEPLLLLERSRKAFARGERAQAEVLLTQLKQQQYDAEEVWYLEADLALRFDDLERAERALRRCDPEQPQTAVRLAALKLARRAWDEARSEGEAALLMAISKRDREAEGWALWLLANAEYRLGRRAAAYRSGERALALAHAHVLEDLATECLIFLGHMLVMEGRFDQAGAYVSEAIALAQRLEDPWRYAQAMRLSGRLQARAGRLLAAQQAFEEALRACRHVGWPRLEARILNELAESCDLLGQSRRSLHLLKQAEALLSQLPDPIPLAINHYNQAFTYLYLSDEQAAQAIALARSALSTFQQKAQTRWTALAWMILAYALWVNKEFEKSLQALAECYRLHEQLGEREKFCEILAMQTQAHLGLGHIARALSSSEQAVLALAQGARATDMKAEVYFARGAALAASGDESEARNYLQQAYETLLDIAAKLEDEAARQAFFRRDPITRRLMKEIYARGIATPLEAGQETRWLRSQHHTYVAPVRWTVDAGPADSALKRAKGAIAVRRQRLARLIREAEAQGIQARGRDLAAALGVSVRTVQRDLEHLRKE